MSAYNRVILMGNLTRDCDLRYMPNGNAVCNIGLAVNNRRKDAAGAWNEDPVFVEITIFGARGEAFAKFHGKGKTAFVEGSLRYDSWEAKDGSGKRSKLYVVADNWEFVGAGNGPKREAIETDPIVATDSGQPVEETPF